MTNTKGILPLFEQIDLSVFLLQSTSAKKLKRLNGCLVLVKKLVSNITGMDVAAPFNCGLTLQGMILMESVALIR